MNRRVAALVTLALTLALGACHHATPSDPLAGAYRFERNGWIYVHLQGSPDQVGYQHGALLAPEIADLVRVEKAFLQQTTKRDWTFYRDAAQRILWPKVDSEYRAELDGIVAGARSKGDSLDRWDIVALNALEELPGYYLPWLEQQQHQAATAQAPGNCSAFVATGSWTADHRIVMGHNAWTDFITGERWNIVFDITPQRGYRMIMDGLPGIITSDDDFGINADGLMVTETTITGFQGFDTAGVPEFVRSREALQYGTSIDDYVRIMRDGNNGGYANDWLLGDNKTGEIARFELGLKDWSLQRTRDGYFVGSNFPVDPKLTAEETNFAVHDPGSSPNARHARWDQLMAQHKGRITTQVGEQMESDAYDVFAKRQGPDERSLCGGTDDSPRGVPAWSWGPFFPGGTVQAKVTDGQMASRMELFAAMGRPCAPDFRAEPFLAAHPDYGWMTGLLRDMPTQPWTLFASGMRPPTAATAP